MRKGTSYNLTSYINTVSHGAKSILTTMSHKYTLFTQPHASAATCLPYLNPESAATYLPYLSLINVLPPPYPMSTSSQLPPTYPISASQMHSICLPYFGLTNVLISAYPISVLKLTSMEFPQKNLQASSWLQNQNQLKT